MKRPKKPGRYADADAWRDYREDMAAWERQRTGWTPNLEEPPDVGVVGSTDHVASFKTKGDRTLIADGDYSEDEKSTSFNAAHDHYGSRREGPGYFSTRRGHYTGPDN